MQPTGHQERLRNNLETLKLKHNTRDAKEALDAEGEHYDYYPDEKAVPKFHGKLGDNYCYSVNLSIYQTESERIITYAIVAKRNTNVDSCSCIIA